jgi:hypothetical protein
VYALHDPFLEKIEGVLFVWLEDEARVGLLVIDTLVRRRAASMPIRGD